MSDETREGVTSPTERAFEAWWIDDDGGEREYHIARRAFLAGASSRDGEVERKDFALRAAREFVKQQRGTHARNYAMQAIDASLAPRAEEGAGGG